MINEKDQMGKHKQREGDGRAAPAPARRTEPEGETTGPNWAGLGRLGRPRATEKGYCRGLFTSCPPKVVASDGRF